MKNPNKMGTKMAIQGMVMQMRTIEARQKIEVSRKEKMVAGSSSSIWFWSLEKRFSTRPVGLDTKKVIGEWITAQRQRS